MMKLLELPNEVLLRREHFIFDDFYYYTSATTGWTSLTTGSGATVAAGASGIGGTLVVTTGGTSNNEAAFATTNKPYKFADAAPLVFEALIQYSEANTNTAGMLVGFSSVMNTTGMLADTTLLPASSFSGAIIYKTTGKTVWTFRTSVGSTNTEIVSQHTAGGSAYQRLRIECRAIDLTHIECVPFLNGAQMLDANGKPIKITQDGTSAVAMQAGCFAKTGSANSEVMTVDYAFAGQLRTNMPTTSP